MWILNISNSQGVTQTRYYDLKEIVDFFGLEIEGNLTKDKIVEAIKKDWENVTLKKSNVNYKI